MTKYSFWMKYWGLTLDPFSEEPLHYNTVNFEKLLVRYAPIEEIDEILTDLRREKGRLLRRRYYIIGSRGMGKTTILNYIIRKILEKPTERILPIYVNNVHVKDPGETIDPTKDSEKMRLNFCLRTIEALLNMVLHVFKNYVSDYSTFEKIRRKYYELKGKTLIDQATAESLLKEYLNRLRKDFDLFLLLYDELDKVDDYNVVLKFLRSSQGLLEALSAYGCVLFICGVPDFSKMLRSSEYSGVSGHEIWIREWSVQDAKALIKSRLDYALFTGKFPFSDEAIEIICSNADGRPRLIQSQARDALIWSAYSGVKKIDKDFISLRIWKDHSLLKFRADFQDAKELQEGVSLLRKVYDPDRDDPSTYFLMLKIFEADRIFYSSMVELKEKYGIDMEASRFERLLYLLKDFGAVCERQSDRGKYYVLNSKIANLFSYVKNVLKESLEYLPRAIKVELGEVKESKVEFNLRNEIIKIFITNPHRRYKRSDIVKSIINNPDAKMRAFEYYKVSSEKELKSKLMAAAATVMRALQREGSVLLIANGNKILYQFSEALEEIGWAKNLRLDEDVLQNYQSAISVFKEGDYSGMASLLRLAVENALRHLAKTYHVELPEKRQLDTLSPINDIMYQEKVYDQGVKTMIDAFAIEVNPICHGRVKIEDHERAKNLLERAQMIIRRLYIIRKEKGRSSI